YPVNYCNLRKTLLAYLFIPSFAVFSTARHFFCIFYHIIFFFPFIFLLSLSQITKHQLLLPNILNSGIGKKSIKNITFPCFTSGKVAGLGFYKSLLVRKCEVIFFTLLEFREIRTL